MKNIKQEVKGNILTIAVDLSKTFGASKTGKSIIIASTEGNPEIKMGVNIYKGC